MNPPGRERNRKQSGREPTEGSGKEFRLTSTKESSNPGKDSKATGPRTALGKQRASHNATKHGVFSKVVVLPNESPAEYDSLLAGLQETLRPEGAIEEFLVEKLAFTAWRHRRLLTAEAAEIRMNKEFVESDRRDREREEAERVGNLSEFENLAGLIRKIQNSIVLERCIGLLSELKGQITKDGLDEERDTALLEKIYGSRDENRLDKNLYDFYEELFETSEGPEEDRVHIIKGIEDEIDRLKSYQKARTSIESTRTQLEIQRHSIPDGPGLDRFLRYEASLERCFDRTLSQLERLQRMRLGQPVAPSLKIDVSSG